MNILPARLKRRRLWRMTGVSLVLLGSIAGWLSWRGRTEEYVPGERTAGLVDSLGRDVPSDCPPLLFTDVTEAAGLDFVHFDGVRSNRLPEDMGSGVALGDVNGDGWVDVFLVNAAGPLAGFESGWPDSTACSRLFLNQGDGTFTDHTEAAGVGLRTLGMAAAFGDLDGDGDLDLFVTSYGRCHLFQNDGTGCFTDVSEPSGISAAEGFWAGIALGDMDQDEDVDVYVCGYVRYEERSDAASGVARQYGAEIPALINPSAFRAERNLLWRNRGDGTFEEVASAAGVDNASGRSLEAVFADFSGDGLLDLYVANDVSDNALYVNRGDGTFDDMTAQALVGDYRGAMGLAVADVDQDHDLDLYITHWVAQENGLYCNITSDLAVDGQAPELMFMDEADQLGLGQIALNMVGWATGFFDYDNDGRRDLFVVNGSTIPSKDDRSKLTPMRSQLFWNGGPERGFFEIGASAAEFFRQPAVGRGGAVFDYDLDGDEDLLVVRHGDTPVLLRNEGGDQAGSVRVRLRQPQGNRLALGAMVVGCRDDQEDLVQVGTNGSYLSQHAVGEVVFGLGDAPALTSLRVTWPDGTEETAGPFPRHSLVSWTRGSTPLVEPLPGRIARDRSGPTEIADKRRFFATLQKAGQARVDGRTEDAIARYGEALHLWPGHDDCLYYLGNLLLDQGKEVQALETFEKLVRYYSASNRGWMQIGRLRLPGGDPTLNDLGAAEAAFRRSHELNCEESGPVVKLGVVALLGGDLGQADRWFADATMLNTRSVESLYFRGWIAWKSGDIPRAEEFLQKARDVASSVGAGDSVSNEGDTKDGKALLADRTLNQASSLERWKTLATRSLDLEAEYAPLLGPPEN